MNTDIELIKTFLEGHRAINIMQLARESGVSKETLYKMIDGSYNPSKYITTKILQTLQNYGYNGPIEL